MEGLVTIQAGTGSSQLVALHGPMTSGKWCRSDIRESQDSTSYSTSSSQRLKSQPISGNAKMLYNTRSEPLSHEATPLPTAPWAAHRDGHISERPERCAAAATASTLGTPTRLIQRLGNNKAHFCTDWRVENLPIRLVFSFRTYASELPLSDQRRTTATIFTRS